MTKVVTYAIIGFLIGGIVGFTGYCVVFISTDILDNASKHLDIEESHIFLFVLFFFAAWGCITGALFALARRGKQKAAGESETPIPSAGPEVWPPAPKR